ncbi:MAG: hypothetical protein RIR91_352 [Verrucomicrobiota bacterium]|jgi:hypothetical protein
MNCAQWLNDGTGSTYARRGSAIHELAARALNSDRPPSDWLGTPILIDGEDFVVDEEMVDIATVYTEYVSGFDATHERLVEVAVPIGQFTGEPGAVGTADAILIARDGSELVVVDLKTGRGVAVNADRNRQMMLYALGANLIAALFGDLPPVVRLVICQPPVSRTPSEWTCEQVELDHFAMEVEEAAAGYGKLPARPGEEQCRWCSRKASCDALAAQVQEEVGAQFDDLTTEDQSRRDEMVAQFVTFADIPKALAAVDLIEGWCSAIRAEAERRLHKGIPVAGFKLVAGKRGIRSWGDADAAGLLLAEQVGAAALEHKLISPATAEKLLKRRPTDWERLLPLISQTEGKPTVAPIADKRPALEVRPVAELFHDETGADLA